MEYPQVEGITPTLVTNCVSRKMSEYIKREDALNCVNGYFLTGLHKAIQNIPTADVVERKRGKWLLDGRCSECFEHSLSSHRNYCPNCGADMRGVE